MSKWAIHPHFDKNGKLTSYWARVSLGRDAAGKHRQKRLSAPTKRELEAKIRRVLAEAEAGAPAEQLSVAQFFERWLAVQGDRAGQTLAVRRWLVRSHVLPALGAVRLDRLTGLQLAELLEAKRAAGWAPASVRALHGVLSAALNQAVHWGLLVRSPLAGVKPPSAPPPALVVWTGQQAGAFLAATERDRYGAAWMLLLATGMRVGELVGLRWEDVDWEARQLAVRRTETRGPDRRRVMGETTKGRRARVVPLLPMALKGLELQRRRMRESGRISPWVFPSPMGGGRPVASATLRRQLDLAIERSGLPRLTPHGLRHTCATLLMVLGVHPRLVADVLGHRQVAMTERYWHTSGAMLAAAMGPLDAILMPPAAVDGPESASQSRILDG